MKNILLNPNWNVIEFYQEEFKQYCEKDARLNNNYNQVWMDDSITGAFY